MDKNIKNLLKKYSIILISTVTFLSGCFKADENQFVGTWRGGITNKDILIIEQSGELFLIKNSDNSPFIYCADGASYQNGKLVCNYGYSIGYDSKNDVLLLGNGLISGPFHRAK
jgi:hypothetical protein